MNQEAQINEIRRLIGERNEFVKENKEIFSERAALTRLIAKHKKEVTDTMSPGDSITVGGFTISVKAVEDVKATAEWCREHGINDEEINENTEVKIKNTWKETK